MMRRNLIANQDRTLIHPMTFSTGGRMFAEDGDMTRFRLDQHVVTTKGVIITTSPNINFYLLSIYQPDGGPPPPDVLAKVMAEIDTMNRELRATNSWYSPAVCIHRETATGGSVRNDENAHNRQNNHRRKRTPRPLHDRQGGQPRTSLSSGDSS